MLKVLSRLVQNIPLRFPYHKYLGPGNNIVNGPPIDIDDLIALQHDIEYLHAEKDSDIHKADLKASQEFYNLFITNLNFHALCGWVGLTVKSYLESKVGVLYPSMKNQKPTHRGNRLYAERLKSWSAEYQRRKRLGENISWGDFLKGQRGDGAGPSGITTAKPTTTSPSTSLDSPLSMQGPPSDEEIAALETGELMETNELQAGGGGAHATSVSSSSTAQKHLQIPRSIKLKNFSLTFGKSRIFYSYAYAFRNLLDKKTGANNADLGDQIFNVTSLAMLPNDLLGFYMSPYEVGLISNMGLIKVQKCHVTVVPQGIRTAFDTGTTLSGTATSEHCAIGVCNVGLNQKYYCRYGSYNSASDSPMIPTGINDIDLPNLITKYYGDVDFKEHAPMSMGIPRHIDHYFMTVTNSNRVLASYASHMNGPPVLDKFIDRFNYLPKIGEKLIDWKYYPKFGYLNVKAHDIPYIVNDSDTCYSNNLFSRTMQKIAVGCNKDGVAGAKVAQNTEAMTTNTTTSKDLLYYSIDGCKLFAPFDSTLGGIHKVVPLIHIGILPTPALNPSTDNINFQNSCAYWSVKCDIILEYNLESAYHHKLSSRAHAYNDEVVFMGAREKNVYTSITPISMETFGS